MTNDETLEKPRNPRAGTRGRPFAPGNPGRVRGSKNRATLAVEALLDGEAEALTRRVIELALDGDTVALRLCLERLAPPRKERPLSVTIPEITDAKDHPAVLAAILKAAAEGEVLPGEAQALASLIEHHRRAVETSEILARLEALEGKDPA
jgi:hypothetical protein